MKLLNIGFGNMVNADRIIGIVSPDSAPIKRLVQDAREKGALIDASYGRRTQAELQIPGDGERRHQGDEAVLQRQLPRRTCWLDGVQRARHLTQQTQLQDQLVAARPPLLGRQPLVGNVLQGQPLPPGQRVGGAGHGDDRGTVKQFELDARDGRALENEAHVGLAGQQLLHDDARVIRVAADLEGLVHQGQQQGAEHRRGQRGEAGKPDPRQCRRPLHRQPPPFQCAQGRSRGRQKLLAGRGRGGPPTMATEQGLTQLLLQHGNALAHHGL